VVACIAVAIGWTVEAARTQTIAIQALKLLGCDYDLDESDESPTMVERVRALLSDEHPKNVTIVFCGCRLQFTDADLIHVERLPRLEVLNLGGTSVSDAGLVRLRGLTRLRYLTLDSTNVTDSGVEQLQKSLPNCKILYSPQQAVTALHYRWFRFSLRAIFVTMALACALLGWTCYQVKWIRERRVAARAATLAGETVSAPFPLWIFGEKGRTAMLVQVDAPEEADRYRRLFPETEFFQFYMSRPELVPRDPDQ
jgi:hypothetical protein